MPRKVRVLVHQIPGLELRRVLVQVLQTAPGRVNQRVLPEPVLQREREPGPRRVHPEPVSAPQRELKRDFRKLVPRKYLVVEQEHSQTTQGQVRVLQMMIRREQVLGSQMLEQEPLNQKALLVRAQDFQMPGQYFADQIHRR